MKEIRIKILSELYEVEASLFSDTNSSDELFEDNEDNTPEPEIMEMSTLGTLAIEGDRVSICYEESDATGMEGSTTTVSFLSSSPDVVTMSRSGAVSATLVFEEGKRHHCLYQTPFMPFEVCVHTTKVVNAIVESKSLELDYIVELRGAKAERTKFKMQIL